MPLALAAGTTKLALFSSIPGASEAERKALPASVFTGAGVIDAASRIAKSDFKLGAKEDKTVTDPALCDQVESEVPTFAQYEGSITPFRYFKDGKPEASTAPGGEIGDAVYPAVRVCGSLVVTRRRSRLRRGRRVTSTSFSRSSLAPRSRSRVRATSSVRSRCTCSAPGRVSSRPDRSPIHPARDHLCRSRAGLPHPEAEGFLAEERWI